MSETRKDPLIERLAQRVRPVSPLRMRGLAVWAIAFLIAGAVFVLGAYGVRPEWRDLFTAGRMPDTMGPLFKTGLFLFMAGLSLWGISGLSRPEGRLKSVALWCLGLIVGGLMLLTGAQVFLTGWGATLASLKGGVSNCFLIVLSGGLIGLGAGWALWLRRAAPSDPVRFGALSALAASALMTVAYSLHCPHDAPVYLLLVYLTPNLVLAALGALSGRWLYRW
ncbi:MAG: DUF1109 domain-containing protein [Asticcacaulis sp.]